MSRIPDSFIQDLLARTDIVELIGSRVELKRAGKEYKGLSPFTHEKSASFFVSPAKQMFFDFSSGKNGTALSFLMEYDRLSFVEAVEEMAKLAGVEVPREGGGAPNRIVMEGPLDALAAAERFFREQLRSAQPAIDYLKKRGLSGATAKLFGIGYAPESWDALTRFFPDPQHAIAAGLLIQKDHGGCYDRFRNRVMFPIRDTRGRVIAFGGRTLGNDPAKYLNSPETPLFHKGRNLFGLYEAKQASKSELPFLLVVEGYMDVVMLAQHGIRNAVATLGTATTREHLALLFKSTARVVFCFDGDRAGRSAAWRALEQALPEINEGRECRFMFLPDGHDPDTLVQEIGADAFDQLVTQAMPLPTFLLGELSKQVNLQTLDGRARLVALARPHLARMREGPLRDLIIGELEKLSRMARADLDTSLKESAPRIATQTDTTPVTPSMSLAKPVRDALRALLEQPELANTMKDLDLLATADLPGAPLLSRVAEFFQDHSGAHAGQLLEQWRGTEEASLLLRIAAEQQETAVDSALILAEASAHLRQRAGRVRAAELLRVSRERPLRATETAELKGLTEQLTRRTPV
jgi:DNA primase